MLSLYHTYVCLYKKKRKCYSHFFPGLHRLVSTKKITFQEENNNNNNNNQTSKDVGMYINFDMKGGEGRVLPHITYITPTNVHGIHGSLKQ